MSDKNGHVVVDGSRLCLSCGLCCQGAIFDRALLRPDEVMLAKNLD